MVTHHVISCIPIFWVSMIGTDRFSHYKYRYHAHALINAHPSSILLFSKAKLQNFKHKILIKKIVTVLKVFFVVLWEAL